MAVPNSSTDYATGYNVNVSSNGSTWATVASCTGTKTPELVSFPTQTAQYLEVVLTAVNTTYWWSIDQFFVYNTTPAPTTTTTTVAPTTTTVVPTTTTVPVPVSPGLWTVDVSRGTRYIGACPGWRGLGSIAVGDIVTVTGYRAGGFTIDAISVVIRSPYGTSWNYRNCPGQGHKYGHGYGTTTTTTAATTTTTAATTTTTAATTTTTGWGYGSHGHRHHGR